MENEILSSKQDFKRIGYSLFGIIISVIIAQTIISTALLFLAPNLAQSSWSIALLIGVPMNLVGLPVFLNIIRKVPNGPKERAKRLSFSQMTVFFFISMAATYILNIVSNLINQLIAQLKGSEVINPLEQMLGMSSLIPVIIFVVILGPIVEELIFRGILLDKLRGYGDKTAIVFTAFTFGLLHGNLSQFFYAFALGLIFGYIAIKTNTIAYTIILHVAVNFFGSVLMPGLALSGNEVLTAIAGFLVIGFMFIGTVLFFKNYKKIELDDKKVELEDGGETQESQSEKGLYLNTGIILFYIAALFLFLSTIFAVQ